jgi:uncharacterized protein (UPF0548 family)
VSGTTLLDRLDPGPQLAAQRALRVNFDPAEVDDSWHHDRSRTHVGHERPGPPEPDGVWETACRLVAAYEMADPTLIRAVYALAAPLQGRDMLLEGRFLRLRFYFGVRVTDVIDEHRAGRRTWGWTYETLEGHLERGRMSYEVVKYDATGDVELAISAFSERAPGVGLVTRLGWALFGRRSQLRFYRECGTRLTRMVRERAGRADPVPERRTADGLVLAPSDAARGRRQRLSIRRHHPG